MSSRWNPRISRQGGGGSQPVAGADHFEASIIIGNIPNGDPAVAQAAPFQYVGDAGNGVQLEAVLNAAALSGAPTRIRLRPGTYRLDPALVTLPLTVPLNVMLEGSGEAATVLGCATDTRRHLLTVAGEIRDFKIDLGSSAQQGATGDTVVAFSAFSVATRIACFVGAGGPNMTFDPLRSVYHILGAGVRLYDVYAGVFDYMPDPASVPLVACLRFGIVGSGPVIADTLVRARTEGFASQVFCSPTAGCTRFDLDVSGGAATVGFFAGTNHQLRVQARLEGGAGPSTVPSPVQLGCSESLVDLEVSGEVTRVLQITGSDNDVRLRGEADGDAGEAINISGVHNVLRGAVRGNAPVACTLDGDGNTVVGFSLLDGDCVIDGNNNIVVASRFDTVTNNGAGNEIAHVRA